jgi:hypothetical protein
MKTKLLVFLFILFNSYLVAQVGIGTTTPKANLDITATSTTAPIATDGLLIPRVTAFPTPVTAAQNGMLVFLTTAIGINQVGMYFYDFPTTTWKWIASGSNPYVWSNNIANTRIEVPKLSDGITPRPSGNEVVITDSGNFGIGTNNPTKSFVLNQKIASDGFLFSGMSVDGTNAGTGFLVALGHNSLGNKQMWFGDADYAGLSTNSFLRFNVQSTGPLLDAVRGDGAIRSRLNLCVPGDLNSGIVAANTYINGGLGVGATAGAAALSGTLPTSSMSVDGNVGIGSVLTSAFYNSTSPFTQKTLINSGSNPETLMLASSSSNGPNLNFGVLNSAGNNVRIAAIDGNPSNTTAGSESGHLIFATKSAADLNNIEKMRILDNGNVGIGTSTPLEKLHVAGKLLLTDSFGSPATGSLNYTNNTGQLFLGPTSGTSTNGGAISFRGATNTASGLNGGSIAMAVPAGSTGYDFLLDGLNGNIGIGGIIPSQKLDVLGNLKFSGALMPNNLAGTTGDILTSAGAGVAPTWNSKSTLLANEWHLTGNNGTTAGTNFLGTLDAKDLVFKTNSIENMRILNANGFVGIGTSAPSSYQHGGTNKVLEISNAGTAFNDQSHVIVSSGASTIANSSIGSISWALPNVTAARKGVAFMAVHTGPTSTTANPSGRIIFGTRDAADTDWTLNRMVIAENGNVGIGTTLYANPVSKLEVAGDASLTSSNSVLYFGSQSKATGSIHMLGRAGAPNFHVTGSSTADLTLGAQGGTNIHIGTNATANAIPDARLSILANGKIGINTIAPTENLELSGGGIRINGDEGIGFDEIPKNGNSTGRDSVKMYRDNNAFGTNQDALVIEKTDGNDIVPDGGIMFSSKGTDNIRVPNMTIRGNGNVGINETAPSYKLQVKGDIASTDGVYARSLYNVGTSAATVYTDNIEPWTDNGIRIYDGNTLSHLHLEAVGPSIIQSYGTTGAAKNLLENNATSHLLLQPNGSNVGVFNSNPTEKLDVVGNVKLSGALMPNNLSGTTGDILTSAGTGVAPTWSSNPVKPYATTNGSSGVYNINLNQHTIRIFGGITNVVLPTPVGNLGKTFVLIGSNGSGSHTLTTTSGIIYDDFGAGGFVSTINQGERISVQSDGTDWIVVGR